MKSVRPPAHPLHGNELRHNPVTGQWVIYSLSRRKRPMDMAGAHENTTGRPAYDEQCPFCPGHEQELPNVLLECRRQEPLWQLRVVENKYPALTPRGDLQRTRQGLYLHMEGYGHHEVVIESPVHNRQIPLMSDDEVKTIIEAYHRRYLDLMQHERNMLIVIFRNYGQRAGASLAHPHSQIISTGLVPEHIREQEYRAQRYFDEWGHCIYCDMLEEELSAGTRIVHEDSSFVSYIPYAAEQPFETWIMPRIHRAHFGEFSEQEKSDLASTLRTLLQILHRKLGDPDYNYVIHSSAKYRSGEPQVHWFLKIRPRLTTRAGFEIGSGMSINTSLPEEDAAFLGAHGPSDG